MAVPISAIIKRWIRVAVSKVVAANETIHHQTTRQRDYQVAVREMHYVENHEGSYGDGQFGHSEYHQKHDIGGD